MIILHRQRQGTFLYWTRIPAFATSPKILGGSIWLHKCESPNQTPTSVLMVVTPWPACETPNTLTIALR